MAVEVSSREGNQRTVISMQWGERRCSQDGWQLVSQPGGSTRSAKHLGPLRSRACAELCVRVDAGLYTEHCVARCASTDGMIAGMLPAKWRKRDAADSRQLPGVLPGSFPVIARMLRRMSHGSLPGSGRVLDGIRCDERGGHPAVFRWTPKPLPSQGVRLPLKNSTRDERSTGTFPARSSAQFDEQTGGVFSVGVWIAVVSLVRAGL